MRGLDRAGAGDRWVSFEPCKRWAPSVWADDTVERLRTERGRSASRIGQQVLLVTVTLQRVGSPEPVTCTRLPAGPSDSDGHRGSSEVPADELLLLSAAW